MLYLLSWLQQKMTNCHFSYTAKLSWSHILIIYHTYAEKHKHIREQKLSSKTNQVPGTNLSIYHNRTMLFTKSAFTLPTGHQSNISFHLHWTKVFCHFRVELPVYLPPVLKLEGNLCVQHLSLFQRDCPLYHQEIQKLVSAG